MAEKIILDTDLGTDCDDAGAIAMLHNMGKEGLAEILGITHCTSEPSGMTALKAINQWYERSDVPVGRVTKYEFLEGEKYKRFTGEVAEDYVNEYGNPPVLDAVKVMRKVLAENDDVTIITIGMLNNIADLLRSKPDEISSKSGFELVEKSVKCMYSMGGNFEDNEYCEYNIKADSESAIYVAENLPKPIIYAGFEVGCKIKTGKNLQKAPENHPCRKIYKVVTGNLGFSWDPICVYCAIKKDNTLFSVNEGKTITFDEEGKTILKNGGKDAYIIMNADKNAIAEELERYIK